jgi:hypothetical protein
MLESKKKTKSCKNLKVLNRFQAKFHLLEKGTTTKIQTKKFLQQRKDSRCRHQLNEICLFNSLITLRNTFIMTFISRLSLKPVYKFFDSQIYYMNKDSLNDIDGQLEQLYHGKLFSEIQIKALC